MGDGEMDSPGASQQNSLEVPPGVIARLDNAPSYRTSSFSANLGLLSRRPDHLDMPHRFSGEQLLG